ncbi:carboxypeptidase Q-like [Oppia nitens]|uniref:carboxypeptidase Q-like n=1 Tax=Oppia nitens TaxID=1686743 RepID=UPI0023DCB1FB|nr:carboxypeptidase Q-like [Oppia nitens]
MANWPYGPFIILVTIQVFYVDLVPKTTTFDPIICESLPKFNTEIRQQIANISADIQKIIDYVVNGPDSGLTYKELALFVDQFGSRFTGTANLESAIDYMVDRLKRDKHDKVYTENVTVPVWIRGKEWAQMVSPRNKPLNILSLGYSVGTNGSVLTGDVIVVKTFDELKSRSEEVRGKFVVYNYDFKSYGESVKYRGQGASQAAQYGAIGALIRSVTPFSINSPHTGMQSYANNVRKIPAVSITVEDAELFGRLAASGINITVSISMEARMDGEAVSRNTVSEITGSSKLDEVVLVSGHLDSWDVGQGAMDDGGGAFISWRALSVIKKLGLKPKRTVRSVLWTGEEMGLIGAQQYAQQHINELSKMSIAMESDIGTFTPTGITYSGQNTTAQCIVNELLKLLKPINASQLRIGSEGSDIDYLMDKGVPGSSLDNRNDRYFYFHHSAGDTMTVENRRDLDLCTAVWAATAYGLAAIDDQLPR